MVLYVLLGDCADLVTAEHYKVMVQPSPNRRADARSGIVAETSAIALIRLIAFNLLAQSPCLRSSLG